MRIVIIGEYSAFSKNLSSGLRQLGNEVVVFSWGDAWKKIPQTNSDVIVAGKENLKIGNFMIRKSHHIVSFFNSFKLRHKVTQLSKDKWDVALVINSEFLRYEAHFWKALFSEKMIKSMLKNPENIFLSACGNDLVFNTTTKMIGAKGQLQSQFYSATSKDYRFFRYYSKFISKLIPVMYSYAQAYRLSPLSKGWKILPTIPLPVDLESFSASQDLSDKVKIFFGVSRQSKGTDFILKALDIIQSKYPDIVQILIVRRVPFEEYLKLMSNANIVLDQCTSYCYGMNAIYAMAMGKLVFSGNEDGCAREFNVSEVPIVNITPDPKQIVEQLESFILDKELLLDYGRKSREYVEQIHECKRVAARYIETFRTIECA